MKKILIALFLATLACFSVAGIGCKDSETSQGEQSSSSQNSTENKEDEQSIVITDKPTDNLMSVGDSCTLGYTVSPEDDSAEVEWKSMDEAVASVSATGELKALSAGSTIISVTIKGTSVSDQFALTVEEPFVENNATAIAIENAPTEVVRAGASAFTLTAAVTAADESLPCTDDYVWSSSNPSVATVSEAGLVTPLKVGTTTVKVAVIGKTDTLFDEFTLNVYPQVPADGTYTDTLVGAELGDASGAMTVKSLDSDILYGGTRYPSVSLSTDTAEGYEGSLLISGTDLRNWDRTYFELKYDDILDAEKEYVISLSVTLTDTADIEILKTAKWVLCWWDTERTASLSEHDSESGECTCISCVPQSGYTEGVLSQVGEEYVFTLKVDKPIRGVSFGLYQSSGENTSYTLRLNSIKFIEYVEVDGIEITKDGEVVDGALEVDVKDEGEAPWTLNLGHKVGNTPSPYEVVWESSNENVATVEDGVVTLLKTGNVDISVRVKGQSAEQTVSLTVKNSSIVNLVEEINVTAPETMKVGQTQEIVIETLPTDCTDSLIFEYTEQDVVKVEQTADGYQLVALKEGSTSVTVFVDGVDDVEKTFQVTVSGDVDIDGGVQTETFQRGKVIDNYYAGPFVSVGSRSTSSTMNEATVNENGFVWSAATMGDARIMFGYNRYNELDFTGDKKYVIRVALTTPEDYPSAGYIMVYGFKTEACDSYKVANAGTDAIVTSEGGSTARKVLGGKNMTTYFDFLLDGSQSSEFFIAYHSASNAGKVGMTASVLVSKVEIIDLSVYQTAAVTETFEEDTVSVSGLSYTGENFDITAAAGDTMSIQNHPAPQLSMYTSGKGLYWVSPRVWQEGLTTNDEGSAVTHNAKIIFKYKGEFTADGSYRIRIPLYMKANTLDQVKTTSVKLFYATAGTYSEVLLETKVMGWGQTTSVFEVVIPANSNWDGQLVMRMYNSAITANSASSKMLCYFDGLSVEAV